MAWPALWRHLVPRRRWPHTAPHASSSARSHARFFGTHSRAVAETRGAAAEGGQSDWRAWFRSADYDDAYGPYSGFREGDAEAEAPSASGAGAGAWDGTWRRRRHGLNLEPLRLIAPRGAEEEDVDGDDAVIANGRRRAAWADAQTRFLCRMLDVSDPASGGGEVGDPANSRHPRPHPPRRGPPRHRLTRPPSPRPRQDLCRTGIRRETDRPRTERCHRVSYRG